MKPIDLRVVPSLLVLLLSPALSAQSYTVTRLSTDLGGNSGTYATGINDSGMAVGFNGVARPAAVLWSSNGASQLLGTLGGKESGALAINNLGQVVGWASLAGEQAASPFLWTAAEGMRDLGRLGTGRFGEAHAINNNTQVVGYSCVDALCQGSHAFLWTQTGGLQDLGTLGGDRSVANGVNAAGQVVGSSTLADGSLHAFIWTSASGMQELVPGESVSSDAAAINDMGQVVGNFFTSVDNRDHAFVWTQATGMRDLGRLKSGGSRAEAINNSGDVAGQACTVSATTGKSSCYSVIWRQGGTIQKLGPLVIPKIGLSAVVFAINASGQIVTRHERTPYVLTPIANAITP